MTHFIDKVNNLSNQCFSAALIFDANHKRVGEIIIRYTNSKIGLNHEVGVNFKNLDFGNTENGGVHDNPATLFKIFNNEGIKCYTFTGEIIIGYSDKNIKGCIYDSLSQFNDIKFLKIGRKKFVIQWVL